MYIKMSPCAVILKTENVTHGDIELIMIIIIELNRETKIHTPTDTENPTINKKHRNCNFG